MTAALAESNDSQYNTTTNSEDVINTAEITRVISSDLPVKV